MRRVVTFLIFCWAAAACAQTPELTGIIARADAAERDQQPRAAVAAMHEAEKLAPENLSVLIRLSALYSNLADSTTTRAFAERALEYAKRAVNQAPDNAKAQRQLAIAYGTMTDYASNKAKVEYSKLIKEAADRSLALDSHDDFTWYILGRWNLGLANVGGFLRTLTKIVYGELPAATNEEAERCLTKAIELSPKHLKYHSSLARTYTAMGKTDRANKEWKIVLTLKPTDPDEEADKKEAQRVIDAASK